MILDPLLVHCRHEIGGGIEEPFWVRSVAIADPRLNDVKWGSQSNNDDVRARNRVGDVTDEGAGLEDAADDQTLGADGTEVHPHARKVAVSELLIPPIVGALGKRLADLREIDAGMPDPSLGEQPGRSGGSPCLADTDGPRDEQDGHRRRLKSHPANRKRRRPRGAFPNTGPR
jgi:hypothetical protein